MGRLAKGEKIMKIVFDSEEQRDAIVRLYCPRYVSAIIFNTTLKYELEDCTADNCKECWNKSGIVLEVEKC